MANPIKSLFLGKWMGDPLHPAIVHIPIAAWLGALVFDILSLCGIGGVAFVHTAFWCIAIGLISTLIVVPAGLAEWSEIRREKPAWKLALWHMILNLIVTALMAASLMLRMGTESNRPALWAFAMLLVGNLVLAVSGYIGGRMTFEHGIAVGRMSRKKWRAMAAASNANLPRHTS